MKKEIIVAKNGPAAVGPYSHACKFGNLVFSSGTMGIDANGNLADGVEAQAHLCFKNLKTVLEAGGSCLENCIKVTVFVKSMGDFAKVNAIYSEYIKSPYPARTCIEAAGLPKGALVEVEVVAHTN